MHHRVRSAAKLLAILLSLCLFRLPLAAADFDAGKVEQLATDEMRTTNTPGAAIAVVRDGTIVWSKGIGYANVETEQPVTSDMLFRLGSTTKMFTAAALLSFAEEGKLRLDEPIGNYLPGLQPQIAALTSHQLLTHTAGLTDESVMDGQHDDGALASAVRGIDASWLFTQPGKIYSYANPGYWIAGRACEQIAGKAYADVMDERMFLPLGMSRTTLRPMVAMTWPLALGHELRGGKQVVIRPQADNAATRPAGQMYSSVLDLARFTTALMDDGRLDGKPVLSSSLISKMTAPHAVRPGDGSHYGYGLMISDERGVRLWQHGGSRSGYGSTIRMAPSEKVAVIILTNRSGSSLPRTAGAVLEMTLPFSSPRVNSKPLVQPLSDKEMAELAGRYTNNRQTIELAVRDGQLIVLRRGADVQGMARPLRRIADNQLGFAASQDAGSESSAEARYFVVRGSAGVPEYLCSGGRAFKRQLGSADQ